MTTAMRALTLAVGPKVMRVGVLQGGRVIEERILTDRTTVTVGRSESATFVIASSLVEAAFPLFERVGDELWVNLRPGMSGRLADTSGIIELPTGGGRLKLTEDARGKIVIGATTFLFQFVARPPVQPRPQLPLGVKGGIAPRNDWALTLIAAFSFLVHFGLVGAMYSDWADPIVGDRYDVAGLVDMMGKIPTPPVVEVPEQPATATTPAAVQTPTKTPRETSASHAPSGPARPSRPSSGTISNERSAVLAAQAETLNLQILAGLEGGPAVSRSIDRSNIPAIDLDAAAARNIGAARDTGELKVAAGGPVRGANKGGLGALAGTKGDGPTVAGRETTTAGPSAVAQVGVSVASTPIPGVDATVANLRSRFRACYQAGLLTDPTMSGKVVIAAHVGPNGEVTRSDVVSNSGLSAPVGQCIADVVRRATFSAPGGGGSTVNIPVAFVLAK